MMWSFMLCENTNDEMKKDEMGGACTPWGRPRHRWEGNIKTDLEQIGCKCGFWIHVSDDRD
jgi:hypothetical protein